MSRTALIIALLCSTLVGCAGTDTREGPTGRPNLSAPPVTTCTGIPGKPAESDSYQAGAPDVAVDGDDLTVTVTVRTRAGDGTCRLAQGALVEIWHTGDAGTYLDDAWRSARRTGTDGTTSYSTVRPVAEENFPHLHVRVTTGDAAPEDWVIGVMPDTPRELRLDLLVGAATDTTSIPASAGPGV